MTMFPHRITYGTIITGVISKIEDDFLVFNHDAEICDKPCIIYSSHFYDDQNVSRLIFKDMKIGDSITSCYIDNSSEAYIFTAKPLLIAHNSIVISSSLFLKQKQSLYGFIERHTDFGSIVRFIGNARGLLSNKFIDVGNTVFVEVITEGVLPFLEMNNQSYFIDDINNVIAYINGKRNSFKIGQTISLLNLKHKSEGVFEVYCLKEWKLKVFKENIPSIRYLSCLVVGLEGDTIYGILTNSFFLDTPPICCYAKCIQNFGFYSLLRYKKWYYFARDDLKQLVEGNYYYLTSSFDITEYGFVVRHSQCTKLHECPIYLGYIESSNVQQKDNILCRFQRKINEWYIFTNNSTEYMLHTTQVQQNMISNMQIRGSCICFLGFNLLITNKNLPIFYEDCKPDMDVNGIVVKYDQINYRHLIRNSPFIDGIICNKYIKQNSESVITCKIIEFKENYIMCEGNVCSIKAQIDEYYYGLYYTVFILDETNRTAKLDVTDCQPVDVRLHKGDIIDVYYIEADYVSMYIPEIIPNEPIIGSIVKAFITNIDQQKLIMHFGRHMNGILPIELYKDIYVKMQVNICTFAVLECIIIDKNESGIILSKREIDLRGTKTIIFEDRIYRASVIDAISKCIYIDVVDMITYIQNNEGESFDNGQIIFVKCFNQKKNEQVFIYQKEEMVYHIIGSMPSHAIIPSIEQINNELNDDHEDSDGPGVCIPSTDQTDDELNDDHEDSDATDMHDKGKTDDELNDDHEDSDATDMHDKGKTKHQKKHTIPIELCDLQPVVYRLYASKNHINPRPLKKFLFYLRSKENLDNVIDIAAKVRVSPKTVSQWHENVKKDYQWSPLLVNREPTTKAMTDLLEGAIMWHIYAKFLRHGYQVNDKICKAIATAFWSKYPQERLANSFKASNSWVTRFKKKYGLVNRRGHFKKRSSITDKSIELSKSFLEEVSQIYREHEEKGTLHYLVNIDETQWKFNNFGGMTWATKGSEHVECAIPDSDKKGVTAIAAITASKEKFKLPICIIKKGLTDRAVSVLSPVRKYYQIEVSPNGWSTIECFAVYLTWLREELDARYRNDEGYSRETKIDLILDLYAVHRNNTIKKIAEALNFKLHFIPASFTDAFQPLDRYVFGALKQIARTMFYAKYAIDPARHFSIVDACNILIDSWASISDAVRKKAWLPYYDPEEGSIKKLINRTSIDITIVESKLTLDENDYIIEKDQDNLIVDSDSSDDDDDTYSPLELFNKIKEDTINVKIEAKKIVHYEKELLKNSLNETIFKPIGNIDNTCSTNTLIQILYVIPGIKEEVRELIKNKKGDVSNIVSSVEMCFTQYEEAYKSVNSFPVDICYSMPADVCEAIEKIIMELPTQYGITLTECRYLTINHDDENQPITSIIESVVGEGDFLMNKILLFKKNTALRYNYPELVRYKNSILVLKILIVAEDIPRPTGHFRAYVREYFSDDMIMISDKQIKPATIENAYEDPICLAIYYVFNDETNDTVIDAAQEDEVITEMVMSEELKNVFREIHPNCDISGKVISTKSVNDKISSNRDEIMPLVRVQINAKTKK